MKRLLLLGMLFPALAYAQVDYTVTVLRLKAKADDCDGGTITLCSAAPQDPVFHIWTTDAGANENTSCWIYDNDPAAGYNMWIDIQNLEIANETNVLTTYITVDMGGFESDVLIGNIACDDWSGDAVMTRQLAQEFDLSLIPEGTPYNTTVNINDTYYAEIEILWIDPFAGMNELNAAEKFVLTPNPTDGIFSIGTAEANDETYQVTITDMSGRIIQQIDAIHTNEPIDLTSQDAGTYFVTVGINGVIRTERINIR